MNEYYTCFGPQMKKIVTFLSFWERHLAILAVSYKIINTLNPLSANPTKWSNTLKQFVGKLPTNCLSVFDHFVRLALKGLKNITHVIITLCGISAICESVFLTTNSIGRGVRFPRNHEWKIP